MLDPKKIHVATDWDFSNSEIENQRDEEGGYVATEMLCIRFEDENDVFVGDLLVHFIISIMEDYEGKEVVIDTYHHIPAFCAYPDDEENMEFLKDMEAFKFMANNFGDEVQMIIDEAMDILYEKYEPESDEDDV